MGKSTPSAPAAPDPYKTASAQGSANVATAQVALNNANVYSSYGSTTFQQSGTQTITQPDGTTSTLPTYSQYNQLSPNQGTLFGQNEALAV